jgi:hypothetical protein
MRSSLDLDDLRARSDFPALIVRSKLNIRRSRALVASADALVRATRRMRRPKLAGGSDGADAARPDVGSPRVMRTWLKMKNGGLPTTGVRRRWVGPGHGQRCNECGDDIAAHETEFEVDFSDALLLRFHRDCFKNWQAFDRERG